MFEQDLRPEQDQNDSARELRAIAPARAEDAAELHAQCRERAGDHADRRHGGEDPDRQQRVPSASPKDSRIMFAPISPSRTKAIQ